MPNIFKVLSDNEKYLQQVSILRLNALEDMHNIVNFPGMTADEIRNALHDIYKEYINDLHVLNN